MSGTLESQMPGFRKGSWVRGMNLLSCLPRVHLPWSSLLPCDLSALSHDRHLTAPEALATSFTFWLLSARSLHCFEIHMRETGMAGASMHVHRDCLVCLPHRPLGLEWFSNGTTDVWAPCDGLLSASLCAVSATWRPHDRGGNGLRMIPVYAQGHLSVKLSFLSSSRCCPIVSPEGDMFPELTKPSWPFAEQVSSCGFPPELPSRLLIGWVASSSAAVRTGPCREDAAAGGSDSSSCSLLCVEMVTSLGVVPSEHHVGGSVPLHPASQRRFPVQVVSSYCSPESQDMRRAMLGGHSSDMWYGTAPLTELKASVSK